MPKLWSHMTILLAWICQSPLLWRCPNPGLYISCLSVHNLFSFLVGTKSTPGTLHLLPSSILKKCFCLHLERDEVIIGRPRQEHSSILWSRSDPLVRDVQLSDWVCLYIFQNWVHLGVSRNCFCQKLEDLGYILKSGFIGQ